MPGDAARTFGPVRPACPPFDLGTLERRGWRDLVDVLCWPVFTTAASVVPRCIGRLIRPDHTYREADPIG